MTAIVSLQDHSQVDEAGVEKACLDEFHAFKVYKDRIVLYKINDGFKAFLTSPWKWFGLDATNVFDAKTEAFERQAQWEEYCREGSRDMIGEWITAMRKKYELGEYADEETAQVFRPNLSAEWRVRLVKTERNTCRWSLEYLP